MFSNSKLTLKYKNDFDSLAWGFNVILAKEAKLEGETVRKGRLVALGVGCCDFTELAACRSWSDCL